MKIDRRIRALEGRAGVGLLIRIRSFIDGRDGEARKLIRLGGGGVARRCDETEADFLQRAREMRL